MRTIDAGIARMLTLMEPAPSDLERTTRELYRQYRVPVDEASRRGEVLLAGVVAVPATSRLAFLVVTTEVVALASTRGVFSKHEHVDVVERARVREAVLSSREDATVIHLFTTDVPTDIAFSVQVPRSAVALQDHLVALLSASSPPAGGPALGSGGLGSEATPASPPDLDLAASGPARRSLVDWASGWVMKEFRRGGGVDGSLVLVFRPGRSTENPDRLRLPTTDRRAAVSLAAAEQAHAERLVVLTGGNEHGGRLAVWVDVYDLQNGQAAAFVLHWKNTRRGPELLGLTGRRSDLDRALELSDRG